MMLESGNGISETISETRSERIKKTVEQQRWLILFLFQMIIVMLLITTSLVNLTLPTLRSQYRDLWITMLSFAVGVVLPNPKIRKNKE